MRKRLIKIFSGLLLGISLFSVPASATEWETKWDLMQRNRNTGSSTISNTIYISNPQTINADSSQWGYCSPYWRLATPDFHQAYASAWANVNGTWYYLDNQCNMVVNHVIHNSDNNKEYYINKDGSLLTNGYYIDYYSNNQAKYYADANGVLTLVK
ncbi:hypothetical protein [Clostridium botulinum]|uniref:hypothetical protein n=1 Tax=Clostridium botulinum TaxID=1491 RepID=UPI000774A166|nr:hypothetical protein [Clostridium botulinum]MBN1059319.1 hypothetical protein [Clostridium botulinum]NFG36588.1 hypothetical protein [Clostridium botulinum]